MFSLSDVLKRGGHLLLDDELLQFTEEDLLEVDVVGLLSSHRLVHLRVNLLVVGESVVVLVDGFLEEGDVGVDLSEHGLDVLHLLLLELQLLVGLGDVLVKLEELLDVLDVKGEVLGPGEECGVGLAGSVVGVGAVSECLLDVPEHLLVLVPEVVVALEGDLEGADHGLDAVRVRVDGVEDVVLRGVHLVQDECGEALEHLVELGRVRLLDLLVEVLDGVGRDSLLDLVELLADRLHFELALVQLPLPLLDLRLESLLRDLQTADLDVEVLLLLLKRADLLHLHLDRVVYRLHQLRHLVLRVLRHHERILALLRLLLLTLARYEVYQLLLAHYSQSCLCHIYDTILK